MRRPVLSALAVAVLAALPITAQPIPVEGLEAPAQVVFDGDAVPHVCAASERDAFVLLGYLHARDRLFQMDFLRRQFSGTLAELVGSSALPSDILFRTLGLRRGAEESLAAFEDLAATEGSRTLAILEAYTDGVNAFLATEPPLPEYAALELTTIEPWTVVDSLVVGKGLAFGLSFDLLEIDLTERLAAYMAAGDAQGFDGQALFFEDTHRTAPFDDTLSLPGALPAADAVRRDETARSRPILDPRAVELARQYRRKVEAVPLLERTLSERVFDRGSNWWVLDGSKTTSGHPVLANDPHLGLNTPATFYEAHLTVSGTPGCGFADVPTARDQRLVFTGAGPRLEGLHPPGSDGESLNVNGVTFAGAPTVVQGCNDRICWGSTVHPMDVTDVYLEELVLDPDSGLPVATRFDGALEPLEIIPQTFRFNRLGDGEPDSLEEAGIGPLEGGVTLVVPRRNRGPIIAAALGESPTALSVQYTGWRATLELEAFLRFGRAGSVEEFREALQFFDVGSQNWAYADVDGNIAYFTSAEMPLREDLQNLMAPDGGIPPFLIRDGTHELAHEWLPVTDPEPQQVLDYQILPFGEMPQVVNPERGYVINANNDPIGTSLDNNPLNQLRPGGGLLYLSPGYVSLRVGRIGRLIDELLADGGKVSRDDLETIQANNQLLDAEIIVPFLLDAFDRAAAPGAPAELTALAEDPAIAEAVGRLAAWDFSTPTGIPEGYDPGDDPEALPAPSDDEIAASVAATIWAAFRGQLIENVVDETLSDRGLGGFLPDGRSAYKAVAHLLRTYDTGQGVGASGVDFFTVPGELTPGEERDHVLLASLEEALELLASSTFEAAFGTSSDQDDYRWGQLHRIVFDHPLGGPFNVPPAGGFEEVAMRLPGLARSGGYEAVDASAHNPRANGVGEFMFGAGPARRFVGTLDPEGVDALEIIPGGQSGIVASPDYASQLGRWLTNRYHPLRLAPQDVRAATRRVETFSPGVGPAECVPGPVTMCLQGTRFQVEVEFATAMGSGQGRVVPFQSDDSGLFWFFDPDNWELLVKVLDACPLNGRFWVFAAGTTNVEYRLVVEDTFEEVTRTYFNPFGQPASPVLDTGAFATCP